MNCSSIPRRNNKCEVIPPGYWVAGIHVVPQIKYFLPCDRTVAINVLITNVFTFQPDPAETAIEGSHVWGVPPKCSISLSERNPRKVNRPVFSLWIIVTIIAGNPFESLHPVPKHVLQGWSRDSPDNFMNCCKQFFTWWKSDSLRTMFDMFGDKEIRWWEIRWVQWVYGEAEQIFFAKAQHFRAVWGFALPAWITSLLPSNCGRSGRSSVRISTQ
jgi:hypothetical protein